MKTVSNARIEEIKAAITRGEDDKYTVADTNAAWIHDTLRQDDRLCCNSRTLDIVDTVISTLESTEEDRWEDLAHEVADSAAVYYSTGYEWLNGEWDSDEFCDEWMSEYCCDKPEDFNSIVMGGYYCWVRTIAERVISYVQGAESDEEEESGEGNVMIDGIEVDFEAAVMLMDDDFREQIHAEFAPCTNQEFMDRYMELDPTFQPY